MIKPLCLFILDMRIENIFQSILYVSFNFALSSQPHTQSPDQEQQAAPESQQLSPGMLLTCLFPAVLHLRALPFSSLVAALLMSPCPIKLKKRKRVQSDKAGKHPSSCPGTAVQTKVEGGFRSAGRAPCIARGFSAAVGKVTESCGGDRYESESPTNSGLIAASHSAQQVKNLSTMQETQETRV